MSETCAMCGVSKGSKAALVEHVRTAHQHDDPASSIEVNPEAHAPGLVCALCGLRFPTARSLLDHNLKPHPKPRENRWHGPSPS